MNCANAPGGSPKFRRCFRLGPDRVAALPRRVHYRHLVLSCLLLLVPGALPTRAQVQPAPPLVARPGQSAADRRAAKPALESRVLDDMEKPDGWSAFGPGRMTFTAERAQSGRQSIRLSSRTRLDRLGPVPGRPFAETGLRRTFPGEDWSRFSRITVDVYPRLSGFRNISLLLKFHAAGSDRWPYTFGPLHHVLLRNERWNHVVWEIPHLPRTNVTALDLIYRLQGSEPGATETVQFDFDNLRLERVERPDPYHGWQVAPGEIAFSHLGYALGTRKIAVAAPGVARFEVLTPGVRKPDFSGNAVAITNALGVFSVLDFTALDSPGVYVIRTGTNTTPLFPIHDDTRTVWLPAFAATLNHFRCQRCGEAVPGIHGACHADWRVEHTGRRLPLAGGWHDAGDLSQGLVNTAEAAEALFAAADLDIPAWRPLLERFRLEGRWGLDWMNRTRFGDGFRATWATMDYWTDNVVGTSDDTVAKAGNGAFDNFIAAATAARASRTIGREDPKASAEARRVAEEDWRFAVAAGEPNRTEVISAAIHAATELHRATEHPEYRERATALGRRLLAAQQTEVPAGWTLPLSGYFHSSPDGQRPLTYEHRGHHQAPVVALAELWTAFPTDADAPKWRAAVRLHADYLRRTAELSAPWNLPAAGIYRTTDGDEAWQRQVRQGIRLDDTHYLRHLPVWHELRGNSGVLLSQTRSLTVAAGLLRDPGLMELARTQLEWHLGRNPFCQSLMFGVGSNYTPQYSAMSGDIVGGLPVGIQSRGDEDVPYWPSSNCYNYAEIWVHASARFLSALTDLLRDAP